MIPAYETTEPSWVVICVSATVAAASAAVPPSLSTMTPACTAIGDAMAEITPFLLEIDRAAVGAQSAASRFSASSRSATGHFAGEISPARIDVARISIKSAAFVTMVCLYFANQLFLM